ncbi:MAG TPA: mercury resistance system transport protein MerF [Stellaceae bacterium]|nr:mercury resistance system transport protein MerF [Stellaceae bacterium]
MSKPEDAGETKLLYVGIGGSILAALCCFAPVLVPLLAAVGLSAWIGWLDYVLFPALVIFLGVTAWAVWRRRHAGARRAATIDHKERA